MIDDGVEYTSANALAAKSVLGRHCPQSPGIRPLVACGKPCVGWHHETTAGPGMVATFASALFPRWYFALNRGGCEYLAGGRVTGDVEGRVRVVVTLTSHFLEPLVRTQHPPAEVVSL